MLAAEGNHASVLQLLIGFGADVSPLMEKCDNGDYSEEIATAFRNSCRARQSSIGGHEPVIEYVVQNWIVFLY